MTVAMKRLNTALLLIVVLTFIGGGCKKKAFDDYYGRPDSLAQPIYQVLTAKGNFTSLLKCIDKSGYKDILSAAGYWTLFAPNDVAFQAYLTSKSFTSVDQLDSATAQSIVTYSLVYNAFAKARLGDYQSNTGWIVNGGFRRRTANYTGFYDDTVTTTSTKVKAIGSNRNNSYLTGDNNNKYTTYFLSNFMTARGLTAADYNYFYPTATYTGFNVGAAKVVTADIVAENGFIHEIDKVVIAAPSIDKYLGTTAQYSEFKKIFDKYLVYFSLNNDATNKYKLLTGKSDNVYAKQFLSSIVFSPNNENYLKLQDNDGQTGSYSMFAPRNDVLVDYVNTTLLGSGYTSLDVMPPQIIADFVNSQMWLNTLWPSKFSVTNNSQGEIPTISSSSDIIDKQVLSNGFLYGTSKVHEANVFRSIYGRAYLDPKYLLMTRALDLNYRYSIVLPTIKYTMVMMTDALLRQRYYDYSTATSSWTYFGVGSNATRDNIQRILATHIILTPNGELDNLSGSGIIETINGDYIKWNAGKFSSAGSIDSSYTVNTSSTKTSFNGRVYYADNLLTFSTKTLGANIKALAGTSAATSQFYNFWQFLSRAPICDSVAGTILGVQPGVFYTSFIPNNAAMQAAVNAGLLPTTGAVVGGNKVPNYTPSTWTQTDKDLVNNFVLYHLVNKNTIVPDGKKNGSYESVYKKISGDAGVLKISGGGGFGVTIPMQITDAYNRVANTILANSNNLADRCVIHLIDNYLQYNPN